MPPQFTFAASPTFWRDYRKLTESQRAIANEKLKIFRADPFDRRLGTHQIYELSSRMKETVYALELAGDLRACFFIRDSVVISFYIGTHSIYARR